LLVIAILLSTPVPALAPTAADKTKGILFEEDVILRNLPHPSFRALQLNGFSLIGAGVISHFRYGELPRVAAFISAAHEAGFQVFTLVQANRTKTIQDARLAAELGVDIVDFDEPLTAKVSLLSPADIGEAMGVASAASPGIRFIINEWTEPCLQTLYEWSANRTRVDIAEDNYANITMIDVNINLAREYHKVAYSWLLIINISSIEDAGFRNLPYWVKYVELHPTNILYFKVDAMDRWQQKWNIARSILPSLSVACDCEKRR
jgi:hypothetical protein